MLDHRRLTLNRLNRFTDRLRSALYTQRSPVQLSAWTAPGRVGYDEAVLGKYEPIEIGHVFAPVWSTHWVKADWVRPESDAAEIHFLWHTASEGCVWRDGVPMQSFSPDHRRAYELSAEEMSAGRGTFLIETAVNNLFGIDPSGDCHDPKGRVIGCLEQAELAAFNRPLWNLLCDFLIIAELANTLPPESQRAGDALRTANEMVNLILPEDPDTYFAAKVLSEAFLSETAADSVHQLSAIGHAHLDIAWLWPVAESRRKNYRTIATALRYMDTYPDYKFVCSQMQLLAWIKKDYPRLWEKIKKKTAAGQFIPCGGSWVEPDCNLPSGESLIRQFLYGQRFLKAEFGEISSVFWNPDVFGYSAQLPQILKICGIRYFLTQKMSWNQFNKFPHSSFYWEGIDGSSVLSHFPPADTYNCGATVPEVLHNVNNNQSNARTRESYMLFGFGDGGSGPTPEMIERVRRMRNTDGLPQTQMRTPTEFFKRLEFDLKDPQTWVGELYLELHRGTYTTQAQNKKDNRLCEILLRDTELLFALTGGDYPRETLRAIWDNLLLNQFHDIIPGSSIRETYRVTAEEYVRLLAELSRLRFDILCRIAGEVGKNLMMVNTFCRPRTEVAELPKGFKGHQTAEDGTELAWLSAPEMGLAVVSSIPSPPPEVTVMQEKNSGVYVLQNHLIRVEIAPTGQLLSLVDLALNRELVPCGDPGNALIVYDDHPNDWDAWDIDAFICEKPLMTLNAESVRITESGAVRVQLELQYRLSDCSRMVQKIRLCAGSRRLDFLCEVDWHDRHRLLRVEFPWNIRSAQAAYEIQSGYVERPTHTNTSWDMARFEVCAQRWADLSEPGYGVALLNDSKYGYSTAGNRMSLSLLRGATYPDPEADQGFHRFSYAVFPHSGSHQEAGITHESARFNNPLRVLPTDHSPMTQSWLTIDVSHLVVQAVKPAEDSDAVIVRLYEAHGMRGPVTLTVDFAFGKVCRVNALEEADFETCPLCSKGNQVRFDISPFEIVTLRFER